jgi:hypothetical protein
MRLAGGVFVVVARRNMSETNQIYCSVCGRLVTGYLKAGARKPYAVRHRRHSVVSYKDCKGSNRPGSVPGGLTFAPKGSTA